MKLTKKDFITINHALDIYQSDYSFDHDSPVEKEVRRVKDKLHKLEIIMHPKKKGIVAK